MSGLLQRRDGLFKRKRNQRINDIYGEDDRGHFRRIFMNGQVNCHIFTGKFCIKAKANKIGENNLWKKTDVERGQL